MCNRGFWNIFLVLQFIKKVPKFCLYATLWLLLVVRPQSEIRKKDPLDRDGNERFQFSRKNPWDGEVLSAAQVFDENHLNEVKTLYNLVNCLLKITALRELNPTNKQGP